ncbi:MAG: (d)CMP kinase [Spirochaetia bacterium]
MVVAIDGPAGVGKSTIAKRIAESLDYFYLNSGNFYRGVTYKIIEQNKSDRGQNELIKTAKNCEFTIVDSRLHINGEDVEEHLHTDKIDAKVAIVSSIPEIRTHINNEIQKIAQKRDIVAEGRDMATVVFPDAEYKIFLDASIEERARRRFKQGTSEMSMDSIRKSIAERDKIDRNKAVGNLKIAKDAIYLDTSDLTIDEVCEKVVRKIRNIETN